MNQRLNQLSKQQLNESLDQSLWPTFEDISFEESEEKASVRCILKIEPSLSFFAGHFPDQPVVPGVIQVHWVGELAQKLLFCNGFSALKKVKFSNTIFPSASLELILNHNRVSGDVSFKYSDEHKDFSSGVMTFQ